LLYYTSPTHTIDNSLHVTILHCTEIYCTVRSVGKKDSNQTTTSEQKQLVSCLLTLIDGVHSDRGDREREGRVFIIATSSKPNDIDQAMRRPGAVRESER
jgi:SpoVK/Ycf46/Vps4 family AAA+-type ATPase